MDFTNIEIGQLLVIVGLVGMIFALALFAWIKKKPAGTDLMKEISETIHDGAMVFLKREYSILAVFVIVVFALLAWKIELNTALAFLGGASDV